MSPSAAGAHVIPNSITISVASLASGIYLKRTAKYYWAIVLFNIPAICSMALLCSWSTSTPEWQLWVSTIPLYAGLAGVLTLSTVAMLASVGREQVAIATSLAIVCRSQGSVLGVSLSGALTQAILGRELKERITGPGAEKLIIAIRESSALVRNLPPDIQRAAVASYQKAIHGVFVVGFVLSILAVLSSLSIRERNISTPAPAQAVGTQVAPVTRAGAEETQTGEVAADDED